VSSSSPDTATVQVLRRDLALQITRQLRRLGLTQRAAAREFGVPQPTLSKIAHSRVADLSLELLIRIAVRAGLPVTLHTGQVPEEAGAFVRRGDSLPSRVSVSALADRARNALLQATQRLTPSQRLEAFLEHNQLTAILRESGGRAEARRKL
jgi:predicted XRE-type DNA-binding protein